MSGQYKNQAFAALSGLARCRKWSLVIANSSLPRVAIGRCAGPRSTQDRVCFRADGEVPESRNDRFTPRLCPSERSRMPRNRRAMVDTDALLPADDAGVARVANVSVSLARICGHRNSSIKKIAHRLDA